MMKKLLFVLLISISGYAMAQQPVADFNFINVCIGTPTSFTDASTNAFSWSWNFGDGSGTSAIQNPNYTFALPGNYTVTLIVSNGGLYDTIPKVVTVYPNPTVNAGADTAICLGSAVNLIATGGTAYSWSPSTGLSSTNVANPIASPTATTTYTVTATDVNGCMANDMVSLMVNPLPNVNAGVDQTICYGASTSLSASGALMYSWSPGTSLSSTSIYNPSANPTSTTTYTVTGSDFNACVNTDNVTITVNPLPIINYTSHTLCETSGGFAIVNLTTMDNYISGGLNMVDWYTDAGYINWISNPSAFNTDSTILYTKITDGNGCENTNTVEVNIPINDITVNPSSSDVTCDGTCDGTISLTPSGGTGSYSYSWTPGGMTTQNITNLCTGTYTYTVIDANGCIFVDNHVIDQILPNSVIDATAYYQTVPITDGVAQLIRKNGSLPEDMTVERTVPITPSNGGYFVFDGLTTGDYIVKVLGDTTIYNCAATYSVNTAQWQLAQVYSITANCNDSIYLDIDLIELPINSGNGTINGRLVESGGGLFNKAPGEPIPDIDITIDQSPGGTIMAATTTDSLGYFTVTNLPIGTYIVYADMFGYGMDISQTIDLNGVDTAYNVVLCSNDTIDMIDMCEMTVTSVKKVSSTNKLSIYPNPAKDLLNIVYNGNEALHLEITDITGKKVMSQILKSNTKSIDVAHLSKGLYIVRLYNQHDDFIQKLVVE